MLSASESTPASSAAPPVRYRLVVEPVRSRGPRLDLARAIKSLLRSYGLRVVDISRDDR